MRRLISAILAPLALACLSATAIAQNAILQAGPMTPGHAPMYVGQGSAQAIVQDGGSAGGGGPGVGLSEQNITSRAANGVNAAPYANSGNGPLFTHSCMYDAPTTNSTGYHYLCFDPNAQGGGLIAYGAAGGASTLPLFMNINGATYQFPFVLSGVVGPSTSVVGDVACWNNTIGTLLKDCGGKLLPVVTSNTQLAALPAATPSAYPNGVQRIGFTTAGDSPIVVYMPETGRCAAQTPARVSNGGGCLDSTADGGSWYLLPTKQAMDVATWGAPTDGSTNAAPAFASACSDFPGQSFNVPAGVYFWNSSITFTTECQFVGQGWNERNNSPATPELGSWIKITNTSIYPITYNITNLGGQGDGGTVGFSNIAFEQDQPTPSATPSTSWTPTSYHPVFTFTNIGSAKFDWTYFYGVYAAFSAPGSNPVGRMTFSHMRGQVFSSFLALDNVLDVVHFDDAHIWPFWSQNTNVLDYQNANTVAITLARVDGFQSDHIFTLGNRAGLVLATSTHGKTATDVYIGDLYCDSCKYGMQVVGTNTTGYIGKLTTSGANYSSVLAGSIGYYDTATGSEIAIGRLNCLYAGLNCVLLSNSTGNSSLDVASAAIANFNQDNTGAAGIAIASGQSSASYIKLANAPEVTGSNNGGAVASVDNSVSDVITNVWLPWTPTLIGSTVAGSGSYNSQTGEYMISGNLITARYGINVSSFSPNPTGNMQIGGFPFKNGSAQDQYGTVLQSSVVTLDSGYTSMSLTQPSLSKLFQIVETGSGHNATITNSSLFTSGAVLVGTITSRLF